MRSRSFLVTASLVSALVALPTVPSLATVVPGPDYYPSGPQTSVDESVPLAGGWSVCYDGDYGDSASIAGILAECDGDYLLMASGPAASSVFDVVAAAPRDDVIFDTGTSDTPHDANGTGWYFNESWSWGFAAQGDTIVRDSCDVEGPAEGDRLCWHTGSGSLDIGYRSGVNVSGGTNYRRVIMESSSNTAPKARNDFYEINQNDTVKLDVLSNDEDVNGDELSIDGFEGPVDAKVSVVDVNGVDMVKFNPDDDFVGTSVFYYGVSDGNGGFDSAKVTVEVFPRYTVKAKLYGPTDPVRSGATVKLQGDLRMPPARSTRKASGVHAELQKRTDDGWKKIDRVRLFEPAFVFKTTVKKSTAYRAVLPKSDYFNRAVSNTVKVAVKKPAPDPKVVDISVSDKKVKQGERVIVSTSCGKACGGKVVKLQKRVGGDWKTFASNHMNDIGRHNFKWKTVTLGAYKMRAVVTNYATSKVVEFDVVR